MGFGSGNRNAAPEAMPAGQDMRRMASHEQAKPLPIFGGMQRIPSVFLSDVFGTYHTPMQSTVGKSRQVTGHKTVTSWVLGHCRGPVDKVHQIFLDGVLAWEGNVIRDGTNPDYVDITIPERSPCIVRLYWGTTTQNPDGYVVAGNGFGTSGYHPAYRGQCYSVWKNCFIGDNRDAPPSVEMTLLRWPKPSWWDPFGGSTYIDADCNAAAFLGELLSDTIAGLGYPEDLIDTDSFNACGVILAAEELGISPKIERQQSLRQIFADVCEAVGGFIYINPANGKLAMGLARAPGGGLVGVSESDLTDELKSEPGSWEETLNKLTVTFANRARQFDQDDAPFIDRGNFQITGVTRAATFQRPWITKYAVAAKVAMALGTQRALPQAAGSAAVWASKGKLLLPGTAFELSYAHQELAGTVMRVEEQIVPAPGDAPIYKLRWKEDRSHLNADFFTPDEDAAPTAPAAPDPNHADVRLIEAPWTPEADAPALWALCARANGLVYGTIANRKLPSGRYEVAGFLNGFAMHGTVFADYPAETGLIDDELGMVVTLDSVDNALESIPLSDGLLNEWLVVVGDEIASAFGAELVAANRYRLYLVRGRFDTIRQAHAAGAEVYLFQRVVAPAVVAENAMDEQAFKLQPVAGEAADLGAVNETTLTTTQRWHRPIEPANLEVNGARRNATYASGTDLTVRWTTCSERRVGFWEAWEGGQTEELPETVLEFWEVGGDLKGVMDWNDPEVPAEWTLYNAQLQDWFGGEVDFVVRAYHRRNGLRSSRYVELLVELV